METDFDPGMLPQLIVGGLALALVILMLPDEWFGRLEDWRGRAFRVPLTWLLMLAVSLGLSIAVWWVARLIAFLVAFSEFE